MTPDEETICHLVLAMEGDVTRGGRLSSVVAARFRENRGLSSDLRKRTAASLHRLVASRRKLEFALAGCDLPRPQDRWWVAEVLGGALSLDYARRQRPGIPWDHVMSWPERAEALGDPVAELAVRGSLPDWAAECLWNLVRNELKEGEDPRPQVNRWVETLEAGAVRTLRTNTLLTDRPSLLQELEATGLAPTPTRWAPHGLNLPPFSDVFTTDAFRNHRFAVQDESSQLCVEAVAPPPRGRVLDACAGAGSKTLGLAASLRGSGRILAVDVHERRVTELRQRARAASAHQVQTRVTPEDGWDEETAAFARTAHRILLDVPCSGLGVFRRRPDMRWRVMAEDLPRLEALQRSLLQRAAAHLAVGSRLIYATCTLRPEENEHQVAWILDQDPGLELVRLAEIWSAERAAPITDPTGTFLKVRPDLHGTDGFFTAVLRRRSAP